MAEIELPSDGNADASGADQASDGPDATDGQLTADGAHASATPTSDREDGGPEPDGQGDPAWRAERLQEIIDSSASPESQPQGSESDPAGQADSEPITDPPPRPVLLNRPVVRWLAVVAVVATIGVWQSQSSGSTARGALIPATINLQLSVQPSGAHVQVDGEAVSNPYEADVPGGGTHLIEASAPGHQSWARWVSFDQDQHLSVRLVPNGG